MFAVKDTIIIQSLTTSSRKMRDNTIYAKNEQDDLTPDQLKVLNRIVEEEYP